MVNRAGRTRSDQTRKTSFVYKARDPSTAKARSEQTGGRFDSPWKNGIDIWKAKEGDNLIRILPPTWDEHDHFGFDVWVHGYVGADNSTYICLAKQQGEHCPICEAAKEAKAAGEADEAKALYPQKKVCCWIIDRDDKKLNPQLWPMSWTMDRDVAALTFSKRSGKVLLIDHPEEGFDLTVKRQGQGLKTRYFGLQLDRDCSPIADDQEDQDRIIEYIEENPIPTVFEAKSAEYLEKVLTGTAAVKDKDLDDEEDEDKGKGRKGRGRADGDDEDEPKGRSRSRSKSEPDEEEEDTDRSSRRTRGRGKAADEEEEDDGDNKRKRGQSKREADAEGDEAEDDKRSSSRRSSSSDDDEAEDTDRASSSKRGSSRRASSDQDEEGDGDPPSRSRSSRKRTGDDDEGDGDEPSGRRGSVRDKGRGRADPDDGDDDASTKPKASRRGSSSEDEEGEVERPARARARSKR